MFRRFQEMRERGESGFTLIELLVVILIIAILAAIAIPVFLNQRKKGWDSQEESALKDAATAIETAATENNGNYSILDGAGVGTGGTVAIAAPAPSSKRLTDYGFRMTKDVNLTVEGDTGGYCITALHKLSGKKMYFSSETGKPSEYSTTPVATGSAPACTDAPTS